MGHIVQDQICPTGTHKVEENQVLTPALANFYGTDEFYHLLNLFRWFVMNSEVQSSQAPLDGHAGPL